MGRELGFSKSEERRLRELCGHAETAELSKHLRELQAEFASWERGTLNALDLKQKIHDFHQGPSREVYGLYSSSSNLPPSLLVARAVAGGFLSETDVGATLLRKLQPQIDQLRTPVLFGSETEADDGG